MFWGFPSALLFLSLLTSIYTTSVSSSLAHSPCFTYCFPCFHASAFKPNGFGAHHQPIGVLIFSWALGEPPKHRKRHRLYAFSPILPQGSPVWDTQGFLCHQFQVQSESLELHFLRCEDLMLLVSGSQQVAEVQGKHNLDTGKREFSRYDTFLEVY